MPVKTLCQNTAMSTNSDHTIKKSYQAGCNYQWLPKTYSAYWKSNGQQQIEMTTKEYGHSVFNWNSSPRVYEKNRKNMQ